MKVVPGSIYNQVSIDCNASSDKELSVSQINLLNLLLETINIPDCVQKFKIEE